MKDVFEWLEDVRTSTMSEAYQMNKDTVEDDVKTMNSRLEKVGKLEEFKMIEQSIAAKSTMAFCTVIGDKMVIANSSGVLVFNDNETKTGIEQAMKETGIICISTCCRKIIKSAGGYIWSYTKLNVKELETIKNKT